VKPCGGGRAARSKDPRFQPLYDALPARVRAAADKSFAVLKRDPRHPSLHFKRVKDDLWSVRIGHRYRALAIEGSDCFQWFWIGTLADYDRLVG
jgi:hypothetical protein